MLFKRNIRQKRMLAGFLFTAPVILYFTLVYYYPLFQSFMMSFYKWSPGQVPKYAGVGLYGKVLGDPMFWLSVKNTMYFALLYVPSAVVLSFSIAIMLNEVKNLMIRNIINTVYFLPLAVSLVAAALIWDWIYSPIYGLLNRIFACLGLPPQKWLNSASQVIPSFVLMSIWSRLGFDIVIFLAALQGVPDEYYEAAKIDGAGKFAILRRIILPLLNPHIVFVTIIELIYAFRIFDQVYAVTYGGPANASRVIILHLYDTAFKWYKLGDASVIAVLFFLFLLVISIFQWRFFRRSVLY